jgi:hypothetical protein
MESIRATLDNLSVDNTTMRTPLFPTASRALNQRITGLFTDIKKLFANFLIPCHADLLGLCIAQLNDSSSSISQSIRPLHDPVLVDLT